MIHMRKVLNVIARGMMKSSNTSADVDSSSSSTIPTAYNTWMTIVSNTRQAKERRTNLRIRNARRQEFGTSALFCLTTHGQHWVREKPQAAWKMKVRFAQHPRSQLVYFSFSTITIERFERIYRQTRTPSMQHLGHEHSDNDNRLILDRLALSCA